MIDREKAIKGLKCCAEWASIDGYLGNGLQPQRCNECPYRYDEDNCDDEYNCQKSLAKDAIALLKGQISESKEADDD